MRREIHADDVENEMSEEQRNRKIGEQPRPSTKPEAKAADHHPGTNRRPPATKRL